MLRGMRTHAFRNASNVLLKQSAGSTVALRIGMTSRMALARTFALNSRASLPRPQRFARTQYIAKRGYAEQVKVPEMAESITEGTLTGFNKEVGDFVEADEEVASIETDKIDVSVNAPYAGTITKLLASVDDTVEVGQPLFEIEQGGEGSSSSSGSGSASKESKSEEPAKSEESKPKESKPKESKSEESKPKESKPKSEEKPAKKEQPAKSEPKKEQAKPATSFSRNEESIKMNRMRLRIAERLKESQNTTAFLTTFNEVDMSSVLSMRKEYKDEILKKTGIKFGFMGLFSRASALAIKEVPAINASIEGQNMIYRDYVDISVAVATPKGLVTPVVRNVESLDVLGVEKEIVNLSTKARDGKLSLEDMAGGTFTISNGGVFGSLYGTPIINLPQCAVLGLHGVKDRPVAINGKVEIRPMMYIALTYDHRIVDGREAVVFLRTIKELIEDPRKMLLI